MNKDLEIIKDRITTIIHQEYLHVTGAAYLEEILSSAERMAAEIERLKEEVNETQAVYYSVLKESIQYRDEIARLKAELEKKEKVLNELRPYLEPAGVEYNDLEEMFDEKHIDRDGPDMVLVPTSHWNKIQTAFYVGRTQMLDFKSELEKRPEVVYCEGCIYKNQCKAAVIFQESTPKMEGPFKFYYLKFCSYGQRRESEEGK